MAELLIGIQARSRSTRLPGKIFKTLGDKSVLENVYDLCASATLKSKVMVLGSDQDHALQDFVKEKNIPSYFSQKDENDLLGRYVDACHDTQASAVIRVTADCPLLDPSWIERVGRALESYAYASNVIERTVIDGHDVQGIQCKALFWYNEQIGTEEHLFQRLETSLEMQNQFRRQGFDIKSLVSDHRTIANPYHPENKLSVDTLDDYERVRRAYETSRAS